MDFLVKKLQTTCILDTLLLLLHPFSIQFLPKTFHKTLISTVPAGNPLSLTSC